MNHQPTVVRVRTATLEIACEVSGPEHGARSSSCTDFPMIRGRGTVWWRT